MPSALYTISYKPTSSVVALCSFEKKELPDAAAAEQLLTALIGAKLPVPISGTVPAIEIPASQLGCDLVNDPSRDELEDILANPYRYRVSMEPTEPATTRPGDGKEKFLLTAERNGVSAITLSLGTPPQVMVTLTGTVNAGLTARLLFDDRQPIVVQTVVDEDGRVAPHDVVFSLIDATIEPGSTHGVIFLMEDTPVTVRTVTAPESDVTATVSTAVLKRRAAKPETKAPKKLRRTARKQSSKRARRTPAARRAATTTQESVKAES